MFHSHMRQIQPLLNTYYCSDPILLVSQVFQIDPRQKFSTMYSHILFFLVSVPLTQNTLPQVCYIYLNRD